jgi:hypothetical protein
MQTISDAYFPASALAAARVKTSLKLLFEINWARDATLLCVGLLLKNRWLKRNIFDCYPINDFLFVTAILHYGSRFIAGHFYSVFFVANFLFLVDV